MPSIKQFSENGPVGVPNRCCTTAGAHIRALTARHPIKPTSPRCPSAWQPNPADAPLIDAEILFKQPGPALDAARFALTLDESANSTQSHVVQLGNFHTSVTGFDCSNDTFAQIVRIRLPHS